MWWTRRRRSVLPPRGLQPRRRRSPSLPGRLPRCRCLCPREPAPVSVQFYDVIWEQPNQATRSTGKLSLPVHERASSCLAYASKKISPLLHAVAAPVPLGINHLLEEVGEIRKTLDYERCAGSPINSLLANGAVMTACISFTKAEPQDGC